jgi:hypothetical protein
VVIKEVTQRRGTLAGWCLERPSADARETAKETAEPSSLPLHHQHLRNRAGSLPIGRIDPLDLPYLRPAIMLELRAAIPDRTHVEIPLAQIDRDFRSWPLQIDVRAVTDACLPTALPLAGA